jgi:hypothetical protein
MHNLVFMVALQAPGNPSVENVMMKPWAGA